MEEKRDKNRFFDYKVEDYLKDDQFIQWQLLETEEENVFWQSVVDENPDKKETIKEATEIFHQSIRMNDFALPESENQELFNQLSQQIKRNKKKKILVKISAIAASFLCVISLATTYFIYTQKNILSDTTHISQSIQADNQIKLIKADATTVFFDEDVDIKYDDKNKMVVNNKENEIIYKEENEEKLENKDLSFNELIVPYGKKSSILLSDGTKIWVNSGSKLKFPSVFDEKKREIAINGEAYLEVASNENQPFYITTSQFIVKVLGTRFNVSAYNDKTNDFYSVVLVEGKVSVMLDSSEIKLNPDQLFMLKQDIYSIKQVDVYDYISWKDGLFQFKSQELDFILNKLSRHYNVDITSDHAIRHMKCSGKLVLFENLENVLNTIERTIPITRYTEENKIIFKKINE